MVDLVRQMDQPRLARADPLRGPNGLVDGEVRRMPRRDPQAVERERVDAAQQLHRPVRNPVRVRDVREAADAIAEDGPVAVRYRQGRDGDAAVRERRLDVVQLELRLAAADLRVRPDVAERAPDRFCGGGIGECVDRLALPEVEGADVVEAHEVIGMGVREEDEVESWDGELQKLQAEVGGRVDEKVLAGRLNLD